MALDPVVNFFQSEIATLPVASGGTVIVLSSGDGSKLPNPAVDGAFNLTIYEEGNPFSAPEIVRVTGRTSDTLTVTRAQEGTTATTKTSGTTWKVVMFPTAKTIQDIDTTKLDVAGGTMTGDLTIPDKIIHSGDTNTAIRFPANDTWSVETNGTEKIRATSTTVVVNESGLDQDFRVEGDTEANLLFVDASADRVGIGTATPSYLVQAFKNQTSDTAIAVTNAGTSTPTTTMSFVLAEGGTPQGWFRRYRDGSANTEIGFSNTLLISGNVTTTKEERMRITSAGNVGIGTTTPATRLDVNGDVTITDKIIHSGDTNTAIRFPAADTVSVETNGSEALRVDSSQRVGLGVTNPTARLDIVQNGLIRRRGGQSVFSVYNIAKSADGSGVVNVLGLTIPATAIFVFIKLTFTISRAEIANVGESLAGEYYYSIGRNGSGSDVVLNNDFGSKNWVGTSTTAGGFANATSGATTIVRGGAEANTDPQLVNITLNTVAGGLTGRAMLSFEILAQSATEITIT